MKRNFRIDEAADVLGTSRRTVYRLLMTGELVGFKVRSCLRITHESLNSYRCRQIEKYQEDNAIDLSTTSSN
ncbi:MAG: helix-turn-helix domain-containing protein [Syntrophaceae bacterium]|nr:helix-turn-helix domain-containing protein [Syntrophaceae bacterium]